MPDETQSVEKAPKAPSPSELKKQAEAKITSLETQLKSYEGKAGYNPFMWKRDNDWDKLVKLVANGDADAAKKILALPSTVVPKVVNEVKLYEQLVPAEERANNIQQNAVVIPPGGFPVDPTKN